MGSDLMYMSEAHDRARAGGVSSDHKRMVKLLKDYVWDNRNGTDDFWERAVDVLADLKDIGPMDKNWTEMKEKYAKQRHKADNIIEEFKNNKTE